MDTLPKALLVLASFFILLFLLTKPRIPTRKREHDSFYRPRQENTKDRLGKIMKKVILAVFGIVLTTGLVCTAMAMSGTVSKGYSWRYKMTVTIETPEGLVTGSAVREMGNSTASSFIPEVGNPADVRGEAVVVDMSERGVLFALISHDSDMEFYNAFRPLWPDGGSTPEGIKFYSELPVGTKVKLQPGGYRGQPKLVTFTDMNDPKSVTPVNKHDLSGVFGQGVKLKGITFEITDEPVTRKIDDILLWLNGLNGHYLHGGMTSREAPLGLHAGNFKKGK